MITEILNKLRKWTKQHVVDSKVCDYDNEYEYSFDSISTTNSATAIATGVASITISNSGSGYTSQPSITANNLFSLGAVGAVGASGQNGFSGTWATGSAKTSSDMIVSGELVLNSSTKTPIRIAETITAILDHCGIILPNKELHEKYPSLKMAWEDYNEEFQKTTRSKALQDTIDNYKMTESLVKADDQGG